MNGIQAALAKIGAKKLVTPAASVGSPILTPAQGIVVAAHGSVLTEVVPPEENIARRIHQYIKEKSVNSWPTTKTKIPMKDGVTYRVGDVWHWDWDKIAIKQGDITHLDYGYSNYEDYIKSFQYKVKYNTYETCEGGTEEQYLQELLRTKNGAVIRWCKSCADLQFFEANPEEGECEICLNCGNEDGLDFDNCPMCGNGSDIWGPIFRKTCPDNWGSIPVILREAIDSRISHASLFCEWCHYYGPSIVEDLSIYLHDRS